MLPVPQKDSDIFNCLHLSTCSLSEAHSEMALAKKTVLFNLHCIYSLTSVLNSVINPQHQDNRVPDINKNIFRKFGEKEFIWSTGNIRWEKLKFQYKPLIFQLEFKI